MTTQYAVDIEEVEYLTHGNAPLLARVYRPRGEGPFPAVVEAHGGAWCDGDRKNNETINLPVAEGGVVVIALDFRAPPEATYPGSVADINFAIRWIKANAARFGTRAEWIGTMGTSSGSHMAILNGMRPHDSRYSAIGRDGVGDDASVPYVVALWPVICPWSRARAHAGGTSLPQAYAHRGGALALQWSYWLTEDAMAEGSPPLILERGEAVSTPEILYVQNPADALHATGDMQRFVDLYRKTGGRTQVELFRGDAYDLVRTQPGTDEAKRIIRCIIDFIHAQAARQSAA